MLAVTKPESKNTDKTVYEGAPIYPYGGLNIRSLLKQEKIIHAKYPPRIRWQSSACVNRSVMYSWFHNHVWEWENSCSSFICYNFLRVILNLENWWKFPWMYFSSYDCFLKCLCDELALIKLNKLLNYQEYSNRVTLLMPLPSTY